MVQCYSPQNFPFCSCNLSSSLSISNLASHQCTVHHSHCIACCHCCLPAWLIIPKESVPKDPTAVTALATLLSYNAPSIPHAHLTSPISYVVYLICLLLQYHSNIYVYVQVVQMFSLLSNLVLWVVLTCKHYLSRHVLSACMFTACGSGTLLGLLLYGIMPVQALQSPIPQYLVSSRMKYRQQLHTRSSRKIHLILHYEKLNEIITPINRHTSKPYWLGLKVMGRFH